MLQLADSIRPKISEYRRDTRRNLFNRNLKLNNNREWFYAHKQEYDILRGNFENDISKLLALMSMYDDELKNLTPKDCIYRIYRDIRFSEDKTPYKTHFGVFMTKYGRKLNRAGYYLHIEPGGSMLCAGLWFPDPALLKAVRKEICLHSRRDV